MQPVPQPITSLDELLDDLGKCCPRERPCIVTVDGTCGSGKSTLACQLASALDAKHIELDEQLDKYQGGYLDYLPYPEILRTIDAYSRTIVDGVCVQEVFRRIGRTASTSVYVKRCEPSFWPYRILLEKAKSRGAAAALKDLSRIDAEVLEYHLKFRPHERATLVYERIEAT